MKLSSVLALCLVTSVTWAESLSLEQALKLARENRQSIVAARLNREKYSLSARALGTQPAAKFGIGQSTDPKRGLGATDQDLYVSQPIDLFGRTSASRALGKASLAIADADYESTLLDVQTEVMRSYFAAATVAKLSQVSEELLQLATGLQNATRRRFEEGKAPEVLLTRATIELERAKQSTTLRKSQLDAALRRLAGSMAMNEIDASIDPEASLPVGSGVDIADRPDIAALTALISVAEAEAKVARRSFGPELELIGLRSPWGQPSPTFGARLQLTIPISDFGRSRYEAAAAMKEAESARAKLADLRAKAQSELTAIAAEIESAQTRVNSYVSIQQLAKSLVEKSQRGYSEGVGTLVDVLEATRALREIEQELAEAKLSLNLAQVARYEAAGTLLEGKK